MRQTPIIEGNQVTFLWHGDNPPRLAGDMTGWDLGTPLRLHQREPDVWERTIALPDDAYIEYLFDCDGLPLLDPNNPDRVQNGVGDANNFFTMPRWRESPWIHSKPDVAHGEIVEDVLDWDGMFGTPSRRIVFYRPPVAGPVPLLIVLDGPDYLDRGRIATVVDNLIAAGRMQPIALALIENGGLARVVEYTCSDATVACIVKQVVPMAREHLNLVPSDGGAWGMMGASMGGLMALYTAVRLPEMFGRVLSQSGAFDSPHLYYGSVLNDLVRLQRRPALRIWMNVALYEWYLASNHEMRDLLRAGDYDLTYEEHHGGHNYTSWRNTVHRGLEHLFPAQ